MQKVKLALVVAACLALALGLGSGAGIARGSGEGYILASAGPDGALGTPDDIYADSQGEVKKGAVDSAVLTAVQFVPSSGGKLVLAAPGAPGGLRVAGVTDRFVSLAWDPVQGANFYRVYADGILAIETQSAAVRVGGLAPATRHVFEVAAVGLHEGPRSAPLEVLTAPAAPAGLRATGTTPTSVSLVWGPVAGAASYKVYVDGAFRTAAQSNSAEIQGLSPNTSYAFAVSAVGVEGAEGLRSEPVSVATPSAEADLLASKPPISAKVNNGSWNPAYAPSKATDRDLTTYTDFYGGVSYPYYYLLYDLEVPRRITAYRVKASSTNKPNNLAIIFMDEKQNVLASYRFDGDTCKVFVDLVNVRYVKVNGPYQYCWPSNPFIYEVYVWGY